MQQGFQRGAADALSVQAGATGQRGWEAANLDEASGNPQGTPWRHCGEPMASAPGLSHAGAIGGVKGCCGAPPRGEPGDLGSIDAAPNIFAISGGSSVLGLRTLDRRWLQIIRHCLHAFKHSLGKPADFSGASVE